MTEEQIDALPISLDTALEVMGMLQCKATGDKYQKLENEKKILLGLTGTYEERLKMFHKVDEEYCLIVRNGNY